MMSFFLYKFVESISHSELVPALQLKSQVFGRSVDVDQTAIEVQVKYESE